MSGKDVTHDGVIEEVRDHQVVVKFISDPACGECHAKGFCSIPGKNEKSLEVSASGMDYTTGEKVKIVLARSHGFKAVFLAYIMPFLIVFIILAVLNTLTHHEALSGILSITSLIPYYLILSGFRNRLEKQFNFRILKI